MNARASVPAAWRTAGTAWLVVKGIALGGAALLWQMGLIQRVSDPTRHPYSGFTPVLDPWGGWLWGVWQRFDTLHYMEIAVRGYAADTFTLSFPPLYPLTMRALMPVFGGDALVAGLVVANVCFIVLLALLYRAVEPRWGATTAERSVWILALFPTAYFFQAAYTEALYLLLVLGVFACAEREQWAAAGVLACLATLTRSQGVALIAPLVYLAGAGAADGRSWVRRVLAHPGPVLAAAGPVVGLLGFWAWVAAAGLPSSAEVMARDWNAYTAAPWVTLGAAVVFPFTAPRAALSPGYFVSTGACVLFGALTLYALWAQWRGRPCLPGAWTVYLVATGLVLLAHYTPDRPLVSFSRYVLTLFPAFVLIAQGAAHPWVRRGVVYVSLTGYLLFIGIFFLWGFVE